MIDSYVSGMNSSNSSVVTVLTNVMKALSPSLYHVRNLSSWLSFLA